MKERLKFAFDNMKPTNWEDFEQFASAFLTSFYPELRTVAKPHDGGRDSELFSPVGKPTIVFQYSVTESWENKIKSTLERLKNNNPIGENVKKLIYVTNQKIGASADSIKNDSFDHYDISLDIFDQTYFLDRLKNEQLLVAEILCKKIVDPIMRTQNLLNSGIRTFENQELQMAHLFLSLQTEDQNQSKNLTKKVYEALVLSILRNTTSSNRKKHKDILNEGITLLPEHPQETVRVYIDNALKRLTKNKIRHWQKDDEYCLSNDMLDELTKKSANFSQRIDKIKEIILSNLPNTTEVSPMFADKVIAFIEQFLYHQGDMFCVSIIDQKEISLCSNDLSILIEKNYTELKDEFIKPKRISPEDLSTIIQNCMLAAFNSSDKELSLFWRSRADSYTTMAFLKKTPNVKDICKKLVSGDVIIDTCVLLPLIAETIASDDRKTYLKIIQKAKNNGMRFFATTYALSEILSHLERCIVFENYFHQKKVESWIGDVPLLYSAFVEKSNFDLSFNEWVTSLRGNTDYVNNIKFFLEDELDITVLEIIPKKNEEFKNDLDNLWKEAHRQRRLRRGLQIDDETIDKLSKGDSDTYEYIFIQRNNETRDDLGYKHWWLTLDRMAFNIPQKLHKLGFDLHTSPAM